MINRRNNLSKRSNDKLSRFQHFPVAPKKKNTNPLFWYFLQTKSLWQLKAAFSKEIKTVPFIEALKVCTAAFPVALLHAEKRLFSFPLVLRGTCRSEKDAGVKKAHKHCDNLFFLMATDTASSTRILELRALFNIHEWIFLNGIPSGQHKFFLPGARLYVPDEGKAPETQLWIPVSTKGEY